MRSKYIQSVELCSVILLAWLFAFNAYAADIAGTVSFVIGDAQVMQDGQIQKVARGQNILVGQTLQTGDNGHIHLRMIDGAFVSLRPSSRMKIDDYKYDQASPSNNSIKFNVEQGVVRSITGKAGEAAKDKYRMNTPLAAIGIRGTDFVVRVSQELTRVTVQSGAIVMSPLSKDCAAAGFGPCNSENSRVLSAIMKNTDLELRGISKVPRPVPQDKSTETPNVVAPPRPEEPKVSADSQPKAVVLPATPLTVISVAEVNKTENKIGSKDPVTPVTPVVSAPEFWWGRWSTFLTEEQKNGKGSIASVALPGRDVVSSNDVFGLFKETANITMPSSGRVGFKLAESEAYVMDAQRAISPAKITSPSLTVDFEQRRYETSLIVSGKDASQVSIGSAGQINFQGAFISQSGTPNTTIEGALSKNADQAGYLFQRNLSNGVSVLGATRWVK
ncbi:FecR family protein [Undibacterium sp. Di24W]|uniref:FecR family protein n=1 Tax=Undibacterium sp. Di24W TaxID=3413033 RepID=UPI003BF05A31